MYNYEIFTGRNGFNNSSQKASERTKDPFEVLGCSQGATQAQIKAAYRRLAMKYHPDQVRSSDGVERGAKEEAIMAKFAEISAAYELSLNRESSEGSSSISHLSSTSRRRTGACAAKLASVNTDFGSGAHRHHFTDPLELFRKTFGSSRLYDFIQPTCRGSFLHDDIHIYVPEKER